jgi:hypothetical protein
MDGFSRPKGSSRLDGDLAKFLRMAATANLVYGLCVEVADLVQAARVFKLTKEPLLSMKMILARQVDGTLLTENPNACSIARIPVEVLEVIMKEVLLEAQKNTGPWAVCACCARRLSHLKPCRDCKLAGPQGVINKGGCATCHARWRNAHRECERCQEKDSELAMRLVGPSCSSNYPFTLVYRRTTKKSTRSFENSDLCKLASTPQKTGTSIKPSLASLSSSHMSTYPDLATTTRAAQRLSNPRLSKPQKPRWYTSKGETVVPQWPSP